MRALLVALAVAFVLALTPASASAHGPTLRGFDGCKVHHYGSGKLITCTIKHV